MQEIKHTFTLYPSDKSIHSLFNEQCALTPDHIALRTCDEQLTYKELQNWSTHIAALLIEKGVKKNQFVGLCTGKSTAMVAAMLGILKAGAVYVPIDHSYPISLIKFLIADTGINIMLTQHDLIEHLSDTNLTLIEIGKDVTIPEQFEPIPCSADDPCYLMYTSGSTGQPKGVIIPHRGVVRLVKDTNFLSIREDDVFLQLSNISFDASTLEIWGPLLNGASLFISNRQTPSPEELAKTISEEHITILWLTAGLFSLMVEQQPDSLKGLRKLLAGGDVLSVAHVKKLLKLTGSGVLINGYGPTENTTFTCCYNIDSESKISNSVPIGLPIANTKVYIVDENLNKVDNGQAGELLAGGDGLALGYHNRPQLNAEKFIANPFLPGSRVYRTGDLVRMREDGMIEFLGRMDTQVKIRGFRIEPGEIENTILKFPGISETCVIAREDQPGQKKLVAYVVPVSGEISLEELRHFLSQSLAEHMMPSAYVYLSSLPLTANGKVDRKNLPAPQNVRPQISTQFIPASTVTEKALEKIWSGLLGHEPIGINDNFFESGGNSLLVMQSIAELKKLKPDFSVVHFFENPTIALQAALIDPKQPKPIQVPKTRHVKSDSDSHFNQKRVAIVGMALRFPGSDTVEEFWQNLLLNKESVTFFKKNDLDVFIPEHAKNDPNYVAARGIINNTEYFDASFFGFSPREAEMMDPQHRKFLEVCWEAMEHAGCDPDRYEGKIGIFAGMGYNTYYPTNLAGHVDKIESLGEYQTRYLNDKDYVAIRVAHKLNLCGPSISLSTACSTSLVAVAQAFRSILTGECQMALAGGVSINVPVKSGHIYQEGSMFSNDGHTRTFDAASGGTVFSDGAGAVVLKNYEDALADGDCIYAVIRGAAVNNDGGQRSSFSAPTVHGQAAVIRDAQIDAEVNADQISYVEAHGTATPLGDPIEMEAITNAFGETTTRKQFCGIGSVKSNIGHLTIAAGVAGLIKVSLSLKNKLLPASINYSKPNPHIDFSNTPFYVVNKNKVLPSAQKQIFGVSAFGVGGTNAHVIVEEPPEIQTSPQPRPVSVLLLSAKTQTALDNLTSKLLTYLQNIIASGHTPDNKWLSSAAYTLQTGRKEFQYRKFIVTSSVNDLTETLSKGHPAKTAQRLNETVKPPVVFLFPGQGSQYVNMGLNLYNTEPVFRESVDRCAEILNPLMGEDIRKIIYAAEGNEAVTEKLLKETFYTQTALFTTGYALARLWMSWGVQPDALIGHSIGEFVAACISGVFTLEDALKLVAGRARLMQNMPHGAMLSVRLSVAETEKYLNSKLSIAAINGPDLCVVSGETEEIETLHKNLESLEIACKPLFTSHAFHSPMMDPAIEPFAEICKTIKYHKPEIKIYSTVTCNPLTIQQATDATYWANHLRVTVRFAEAVQNAWQENPNYVLLECGPRATASTLARQQATDLKKQIAIASLSDSSLNNAELHSMHYAIGQLWLSGITINWKLFYQNQRLQKVALPTYPFELKRFWLDPVQNTQSGSFKFLQPQSAHQTNYFETAVQNSKTEITEDVMPSRNEIIITELKEMIEDATGIESKNLDTGITFTEMGLDSLFLTQAAMSVSKKYGLKITFRQLNENLSTIASLAAFIDNQLPETIQLESAKKVPNSVNISATMKNTPTGINSESGMLQQFLLQQMQLLQQQLTMMGAVPVSEPAPLQVHEKPATPSSFTENVTADEQKEISKPFGAIARIETRTNEDLTDTQKQWLEQFIKAYNEKTSESKAYTQRYRKILADPRVVTGFKPQLKELIYQLIIDGSKGAHLFDLDGNQYIDILSGFGSNMFGHSAPFITAAISEQLKAGYEVGPQHPLAAEVAELICDFTGFERAALCNTGSEAVLGCIRMARTVTNRSLIVMFNGSYHGIIDEVIARSTKKHKTFPAAAGILPEAVQNILVLDYGTDETLEYIRSHAHEIAAVLVEPIQSRRADFKPVEFLKELRTITETSGTALIFDEVITGFRLAPGGAQEYFGIRADIAAYGKVCGGGMPIGVMAGKREYMDALDGGYWQFGDDSVPEIGVTYFAGTFVRHPFALAAAKAALLYMKEQGPQLQQTLNKRTSDLVVELNAFCLEKNVPFYWVSFASLFKIKYKQEFNYSELLFFLLRLKGIHVYDGFPCFLTIAHDETDIRKIIDAHKESIEELINAGFIPLSKDPLNASSSISNPDVTVDINQPPLPDARLGKDANGNPAWFIPDPDRPGKYLLVSPEVVKN